MFKKVKEKKKDIINIIIIILFVALEIFLITKNGEIFASTTDYFKQDVALPNYFRNLFYETRDLFPNFAFHIGAGQNIYNFAYYGLFSPIVLVSYFLPKVNMLDYMMLAMVLNIMFSGVLMYIFLRKNNFKEGHSLIGALLLVSSCSFLFNSARHTMFVDYMSFFILALMGVKNYNEGKSSALLIIGTVLIILTSYFYSIPCIIGLFIYNIYLNINNDKNKIKDILIRQLKLGMRILIAVLISCFLLLPIVYTLKFRTTYISESIDLLQLIKPRMPSQNLFHSQKGLGLNSITLVALIFNLIYKGKNSKVTSIILIILFLIPVFGFILNGFLYSNPKVFIPFLPIFILLIANVFKNLDNVDYKFLIRLFFYIVIFTFIFIRISFNKIQFLIDLSSVLVLLALFKKRKKMIYLFIIVILCSSFTIDNFYTDKKEISKEQYSTYKSALLNNIASEINNDITPYRYQKRDNEHINLSDAKSLLLPTVYSSIINLYYTDAYNNSFYNPFPNKNYLFLCASKNPFYLRFMGVKYQNSRYDQLTIDDKIFPIGYFSDHILSYQNYNELSSIEKLQAYQNNIIADSNSQNSNLEFKHKQINYDLNKLLKDNFEYQEVDGHFKFETKEKDITYKIDKPLINKTLIIRFNLNNNPSCENYNSISINGIQNISTCEDYTYHFDYEFANYVIYGEKIDELNIEITKGTYDISDLEVYTIDNSFFENIPTVAFQFDKDKTKGDNIEGSIEAPEDGYVMFTIPYDKGFTIYVDDEETEYELVNEGFIGFKVDKGQHHIKINYVAPYSNLGKRLSILGLTAFSILLLNEKKYRKLKPRD